MLVAQNLLGPVCPVPLTVRGKSRHAAADEGVGSISKCNRTGLFLHGDALEGAVVVVGSNLLDVGPRPRLGYSPIYIVRRPLDVAAV